MANWVKKFIGLADIDSNVFQAHSIRSAPSLKGKDIGLSLQNVLERRGSGYSLLDQRSLYEIKLENFAINLIFYE